MAAVDHGLSQAGRTQAEGLWRRIELEACLADVYTEHTSTAKGEGEGEEKTKTAEGDESQINSAPSFPSMEDVAGAQKQQEYDGDKTKGRQQHVAGDTNRRVTPLSEEDLKVDSLLHGRSEEEAAAAAVRVIDILERTTD